MPKFPLPKWLFTTEFNWQRVGISILFIYTIFGAYVFFRADSLVFSPQPASYQDTKDILKIPVTKTEQISAIYLPNSRSVHTVIYIHGNAEDLGDIRPQLDLLHSWGYSVFAYDYRGYGTSNGTPSEQDDFMSISGKRQQQALLSFQKLIEARK